MLQCYRRILDSVGEYLNEHTTLEQDSQELAATPESDWQMRMAIVYRFERKKIWHSQLELIQTMVKVLTDGFDFLQSDTRSEAEQRNKLTDDSAALESFGK